MSKEEESLFQLHVDVRAGDTYTESRVLGGPMPSADCDVVTPLPRGNCGGCGCQGLFEPITPQEDNTWAKAHAKGDTADSIYDAVLYGSRTEIYRIHLQ